MYGVNLHIFRVAAQVRWVSKQDPFGHTESVSNLTLKASASLMEIFW